MHFGVVVVGPDPERQLAAIVAIKHPGPEMTPIDWWAIGGRWGGYFVTKDGESVDHEVRKGDVDWDAMRARSVDDGGPNELVPTLAILVGGRWHEAVSYGASGDPGWPARWWEILSAVDDDELLSIADAHA